MDYVMAEVPTFPVDKILTACIKVNKNKFRKFSYIRPASSFITVFNDSGSET